MDVERSFTPYALLLACFLVACGGDEAEPSLEGTYEVINHTRNNTGCEQAGREEVSERDAFFRLEERDGQLRYYACESAETCDTFANDTRTLDEESGEGWMKQIPSATQTNSVCELGLIERRAEPDRNGVRLSRQGYRLRVDEAGFECVDEAVLARRAELECVETETIIAVAVD